jgi:hypothetical protein
VSQRRTGERLDKETMPHQALDQGPMGGGGRVGIIEVAVRSEGQDTADGRILPSRRGDRQSLFGCGSRPAP